MDRSKAKKTSVPDHIVVNGFHVSTHEIRFVPEARAAGVSQEPLPPHTVRFRPSPRFKGFEIPPILAHPGVRRKQREQKVFVQKQPVWLRFNGARNLRTEARQSLDAG